MNTMKLFFSLLCLLFANFLSAQGQSADFEQFNLPPESFLNGADGNGGFSVDPFFFPNQYEAQFMSWSGWAISNKTDVSTPGFINEYSAIPGSGAEGSVHYAVTYDGFGNNNILLQGEEYPGQPFEGLYVTNSTYAFLSMQNGDGFAKKFGGLTGDDPDFFLLTIKVYFNGLLSTDSVNFYLADYRFTNNNEDYIVDEWTWVDLGFLGPADSLSFSLSSTDVGQFGMNTPAYFCIDNVVVLGPDNTSSVMLPNLFEIYPNPASDFIHISHSENELLKAYIYDSSGKMVLKKQLDAHTTQLDLHFLPSGKYTIYMQSERGYSAQLFVKP